MTADDGPLLADFRALVERQARAWEDGNFDLAAGDWQPDGALISPGGMFPVESLRDVMAGYHARFMDLTVVITNVFLASDGRKGAVEWLWTVTRRSDGARGATPDAIIVDLVDGKISSWREYFNLLGSIEAD